MTLTPPSPSNADGEPEPMPLGDEPEPMPLGDEPEPKPLGDEPAPVPLGDEPSAATDTLEHVDRLNGSAWLTGRLDRGNFRRLSDYVNHAHGRILLHDAVDVASGQSAQGQAPRDAWFDPFDLDIIGQRVVRSEPPPDDMAIDKNRHWVTALTSSHRIRGTLHIHHDADLSAFLRAQDQPLVVMTDAVVTWLADGRIVGEFALALLNPRRTFAMMPD